MKGNVKILSGIIIFISILFSQSSCKKEENPNIKLGRINFAIDPNSTQFIRLNTVGGWEYITTQAPSRGVIVYRNTPDEFFAYERTPPNSPNECFNGDNYTHLVVDFPWVIDTCMDAKYNIITGGIQEGPGRYPLYRLKAVYDGITLRVFNNK
ncbi:MAG: hypothetical protein ACEPOV_00285 [Hyphomicrobiales bacterium]